MKNKTLEAFIAATLVTTIFGWLMGWISARIYFSDRIERGQVTETAATTESMLVMINKERETAGLSPVTFSERVAEAAEDKACDMKERNYFDHQDPQGRWGWHFLIENEVRYDSAGENIAKAQRALDHEAEMREFMKSPKHREIILDPRYTNVGYASCGLYTVQFFIK